MYCLFIQYSLDIEFFRLFDNWDSLDREIWICFISGSD